MIERCADEELAAAVLEFFDWQAFGSLLTLEDERKTQLFAYYESMLRAELGLPDRTGDLILGQVSELAERLLERNGKWASAAAVYALDHDLGESSDCAMTHFQQTLLRYKLSHVLWLPDEKNPAHTRRCVEFLARTNNAYRYSPDIPEENHRDLKHRLGGASGRLWSALGVHREARRSYSQAFLHADNPDDKLGGMVGAANAQARSGDPSGAYEVLCDAKHLLDDCRNIATRHFWESSYSELHISLGGEVDQLVDELTHPGLRSCVCLLSQMLHGSLDSSHRSLLDVMNETFDDGPDNFDAMDGDAIHRHLIWQTMFEVYSASLRQEQPSSDRVRDLLAQASEWEEALEDSAQMVDRKLMVARIYLEIGQRDTALGLFADGMPAARQHLEPSERLTHSGHYLEALGGDGEAEIFAVAGHVVSDLRLLLENQASPSARRRAVAIHQRVVESAVLSLLALAESSTSDPTIQRALGIAWTVMQSCRNVELNKASVRSRSPGRQAQLRELEDAFHASLRADLLTGQQPSWPQALEPIYEFALSTSAQLLRHSEPELKPSDSQTQIAFFQIRDLLEKPVTFSIGWRAGRFCFGSAWSRGDLKEKLDAWSKRFTAGSTRDGRGVWIQRRADALDDRAHAPGFSNLIPLELALELFASSLDRRSWAEGEASQKSPASSSSWVLYPDDESGAIPFEMLPLRHGVEARLGQNRSLVYALRNQLPEGLDEPVDLRNGWLGLGGVPGTGAITALPGTEAEVRRIRRRLRERGYPADALLGREAQAERLADALAELKPSVLHLAAHGFADSRYPDACTLVLADCPSRPERELLPFRRIEELPLDSVRLVVLSACSSLVGRAVRGTTMEGLAWAFLRRGVIQVVASRYPVDDHATSRFMSVFYEHLSSHSVGMALGRARDLCLREHWLDPRQVAAWSVWC